MPSLPPPQGNQVGGGGVGGGGGAGGGVLWDAGTLVQAAAQLNAELSNFTCVLQTINAVSQRCAHSDQRARGVTFLCGRRDRDLERVAGEDLSEREDLQQGQGRTWKEGGKERGGGGGGAGRRGDGEGKEGEKGKRDEKEGEGEESKERG